MPEKRGNQQHFNRIRPVPLNDSERKELLGIARSAIEARLARRPLANPAIGSEGLKAESGAFVTLLLKGRLRGCIGVMASKDPLWKTVRDMAIAAATKDPRFIPVAPDELRDIAVEISVISPFTEVKGPEEVEVGRHGVVIVKGKCRGVLLPQVATEYGFDSGKFVDETCMKAGLPPGAWQDGASIFVFEAEVFGERERAGA